MSHMITFLGVGLCELCQSHRDGERKIFLNGRNRDPEAGRKKRAGRSRITLKGQADWLDLGQKCMLVNLKVRYSMPEISKSRMWITELFCTGSSYIYTDLVLK